MKAVCLHARGGPEQLIYEDAPKPSLRNGDALVRVHGCGITQAELTWDATYSTHDGAIRLPTIPGHEISGVVEAAGSTADVKVGDEVFGLADFWRNGAAAEYVAVDAADLAPRPKSLNYVQAAAVPLAGLTAWQALFDHAGLTAGQEILIHGATGGVGSFAVQLAHWRGAFVVGTARSDHVGLARELGADKVIDYTKTRFEEAVRDADVVLDTVGGEIKERSWSVLRRGGVLVTIVGESPVDTATRHGVRGVFFIVKASRVELKEIARLIDAGKVRPIIGATYPLENAREAFERGDSGHNLGKVVLQVTHEDAADRDPVLLEKAA
jgi:NADPH:quinone reductase-like Zn-dependent oxidoreductase